MSKGIEAIELRLLSLKQREKDWIDLKEEIDCLEFALKDTKDNYWRLLKPSLEACIKNNEWNWARILIWVIE